MLKPTVKTANGYRVYDGGSPLWLQQIHYFWKSEFSLAEIRGIMTRPAFDRQHALELRRKELLRRVDRLEKLIVTVYQPSCIYKESIR